MKKVECYNFHGVICSLYYGIENEEKKVTPCLGLEIKLLCFENSSGSEWFGLSYASVEYFSIIEFNKKWDTEVRAPLITQRKFACVNYTPVSKL